MALFDRLFEPASALDETERQQWLAVHCPDPEVRAELESLLPHAAHARGFTDVVLGAAGLAHPGALPSGHMIGPYRIVGMLGEGGMGAVYEGVRDGDQFRQRVAVKVLRIGARSQPLRQRFLQERQILAELEHPNIARLFDGGTAADGSPYLVMERIDGEPLIAFADSRKLSIRQRLELFRQVASAVQYAHQKLIVHRDLKPGNILVTAGAGGRPIPKLLDFGIAKLLDPMIAGEEILTATGFHLMTPDYASPEQVQGKPVTAASDVYSLGAVLYELLSGARPHGLQNYDPAEIAERICMREVAPPSATGAAALRGDLDTIVLKAMHRIPERRYNSVEQFSEDLRRYLEGMPVLARPDTAGYRIRKFVGRHWVGLGATIAVILALTAGIGLSMYQARLAKERFELVRTLSNRFLFDFYTEISNVSGTTKAQQMVVNTAVEYLDKLGRTAGSDSALLEDMAKAYGRLADVQGVQNTSHSSSFEDALANQHHAVDLYQQLVVRDPGKRRNLAVALQRLARIELILHQSTSGLQHSREAARILDAVLDASPADMKALGDAANAYNTVALDLYEAERPDEALPANLKAQQYQSRAGSTSSFAGRWRAALYQQNEAKIRLDLGDVDAALALLERVLGRLDEMAAAAPKNLELSAFLDQHLGVLGDSLDSFLSFSADDPRRAEAVYERRLESARKLLESDPADRQARINMAIAESEIATPWIELDPHRAIQFAQSALARWDDLLKERSEDEFTTPVRARARMRLALALIRAGRSREALQPSAQAAESLRRLRLKYPGESYYWRNAVFALTISAQALASVKPDREAQTAYEEAADLGEKLRTREHSTLSHTVAASYVFDQFADYWKTRGDLTQMRQWLERSREAWAARPVQTSAVLERRQRAEGNLHGTQP